MTPRVSRDLRMSIAALAMAWCALLSWRGMVELPFRYLWITLAGGLLLTGTGVLGRAFGRAWYAVLAGQLVVGLVFLNLVYARDRSWAGLVPTRSSVTDLGDQVVSGAVAIGKYLAPVPSQHSGIYPYLVLLGLLIILAVDLLAAGLRHPPLAGLPALLALTVPISILDGGLPFVIFALTAIAFLVMLAESELDRLLGWGRSVAAGGRTWDETDERGNRAGTLAGSLRIGLVALVVAAVIATVVPVADDPFGLHDGGDGTTGDSSTVVVNPLLNLKRDLTNPEPIPLLYVDSDDPDPSYVRMTVLDEFTGRTWEPSARKLPESNKADGALPLPLAWPRPSAVAAVTGGCSSPRASTRSGCPRRTPSPASTSPATGGTTTAPSTS